MEKLQLCIQKEKQYAKQCKNTEYPKYKAKRTKQEKQIKANI
jgi:hypothetical protein